MFGTQKTNEHPILLFANHRKLDKEIGQRFVSLPKDKITAHKRSRQEMKRHIDLELHKLQAQKLFPFSLQG